MRIVPLFLPVLLASLPGFAQSRSFRVDGNHTVFGFKAATPLFDVPGRFDRYRAWIQGDPATLAGVRIRIELDARSINTGNRTRDEHLRGADFFEVARYPKVTFSSTQVRREGERLLVKGTLELHGTAKEMEIAFLPAEGRNGADVATWSYRATLPLDRLAFGLGADSVAAKLGLNRAVELDLLLVGFFEAPEAVASRAKI